GGKLAFSPDSRSLAVVRSQPASIDIWDTEGGRKRLSLTPGGDADFREMTPVWSPDGHNILGCDQNRDRENVVFVQGGCINRRMIISEVATTLRVWEVTTGQPRWQTNVVAGQRGAPPTWFATGLRFAVIQNRILRTFRIGRDEPLSETLVAADATIVA